MTSLYFGGCEQKVWRTFLANQGVEHVSLSYMGLRRRIKDPMNMSLDGAFPSGLKIFLDSGAYTLNKDDAHQIDDADAERIAGQYYQFVEANLDRIEFFSEFDALSIGNDKLGDWRDRWYGEDKFMPIWHDETGTGVLKALAELYSRVGILQSGASGDISHLLRQLASKTKLHGVAMTRMESMKELPWDSVGSTSWLSTTQYGDTFVWTGHDLIRYPKKYKDRARKRHRSWLDSQGFDVAKIEEDDNAELLRLSVWSWLHFAESLNRRVVTNVSVLNPFGNEEPGSAEVDTPGNEVRNTDLIPSSPPEGRMLLPVMGFETVMSKDADGTEVETRVLSTPSNSGLLRCDNCYMRDKCPAMTPGSECKYEIPVKVRTAAEVRALRDALLEMQSQRVLMMRMIEQSEGGYMDENTSREIDRLNKMIAAKMESEKDSFSIKIEASGNTASTGMIGRIFGESTASKMGALPAGEQDSRDYIDAEIINDEG